MTVEPEGEHTPLSDEDSALKEPSSTQEDSASKAANAVSTATGIGPKTLSITLQGKRYHVPYGNSGLTVLEACKAAGIVPPSSCEAGRCGTCKATLKYGSVDRGVFRKRALSDKDIEENRVLTCQAKPCSTEPFGLSYDEEAFVIQNPHGAPQINKVRVLSVSTVILVVVLAIHFVKNAVL